MKNNTVLIVDDDEVLQEVLQEFLSSEGYEVANANSSRAMEEKLKTGSYNIILLDRVLPDTDGLTLLPKIREYTDVPVIITSSKGDQIDKVAGLDMGADDYITKPLPMQELASRIKAQLRRYNSLQESAKKSGGEKTERLGFGKWILDCSRVQVFDDKGRSCNLSAREFRLVETFVRAPNRVLSREQLLDKTRPEDLEVTDRAIDVQILRIRRKIGDTSDTIQTVRGVGYVLATVVKEVR
jgi:DNA-binding response OmpR family regulator